MIKKAIDTNQRKAAIAAGIAIVIMTIAAIVSNDLTILKLIVPGDALETWENIVTSKMLFRIGVFSWLIVLISDAFAAWGLYIFFKPVNKNIALLMAWLRLVYVAVLAASIMNLVHVLLLINGAEYLSGIGTTQLQTQVLFYINAFYDFWECGLIIFGLHILFLGWLVFKSGFRLKVISILLFLAFFGYTIINVSNLLFPQYENIMYYLGMIFFIPMISEVALGIWLLFVGIIRKPAKSA